MTFPLTPNHSHYSDILLAILTGYKKYINRRPLRLLLKKVHTLTV